MKSFIEQYSLFINLRTRSNLNTGTITETKEDVDYAASNLLKTITATKESPDNALHNLGTMTRTKEQNDKL